MELVEFAAVASPLLLGGVSLYGTWRAQDIARNAATEARARADADARRAEEREEVRDRRAAVDHVVQATTAADMRLSDLALSVTLFETHLAGRAPLPDPHPVRTYRALEAARAELHAAVRSLELRLQIIDDLTGPASHLINALGATSSYYFIRYLDLRDGNTSDTSAREEAWDEAVAEFVKAARNSHSTAWLKGKRLRIPHPTP